MRSIIIAAALLTSTSAMAHCYWGYNTPDPRPGCNARYYHGIHYAKRSRVPPYSRHAETDHSWTVVIKPEQDLLPPGYKVIWKPGDPIDDDTTSKLKALGKKREQEDERQ